jgi:O-antigen/teichoic acid export membrane protein
LSESQYPAEPDSQEPAAVPPGTNATPGTLYGRFAVLFISDICSRGLRFLADVVLFRHFGDELFGQLNLAQFLAMHGMCLGTCGLDTAGTRDVASGAVPAPVMAATVVALRLALGLVAWCAVAALTLLVPQYRPSFQLAALYGLSIVSGALTLGWVAQGRGQVHVVGLASLATHLGYFCGVELTARAGWPQICVPLSLVVSETLTAAGLWVWMLWTVGAAARPLPFAAGLKFLRESLPIGGANYLRLLTFGSDVLLLGLFVTEAELGRYSVGFKLYSVGVSMLSVYFTVWLLPHLAAKTTAGPPEFQTNAQSILRKSLAVVVPLAVIGSLLAGTILQLLFARPGFRFDAATAVCQVLLLALPANLVAGHFRSVLIAVGRQRLDVRLVAAGAIVHVAAKLILIALLGMIGAAWGTLLGETVLMLLAWQACRAVPRDNV